MTFDPSRRIAARAVVTGMVIGGVLCLSNVYVVLKTGWSLGVTLVSSIFAYSAFRLLSALGVTKRPLSPIENVGVASVASSAGFMTGGGNMAALPALLLLTGERPGGLAMFLWFGVIAALGVFMAIPLKRRIIDVERLPFPSSVAAAEAIRSMHAGGSDGRARRLVGGGLAAGVFTFLRDSSWLTGQVPGHLGLPFTILGREAARWSLALDLSPVMVGGGVLMGWRTAWSMLLGAGVAYGLVAPRLVEAGVIGAVEYKAIVQLTLWPGAGLLVASALTSVALRWRMLAGTLAGLLDVVRSSRAEPAGAEEAPAWWFVAGVLGLSPVVVVLMHALFDLPWWAASLAIPLSMLMAVVSSRVTGETDVTPTKAVGPATQLVFGTILPGHLGANVMAANVTGGIGLHAADLLSDLKSGWVLGASPRQQVIAQLFGVLVGAAVVVPAFELLVPSADVLGTEHFPAPAVMVWAGVSKALAGGLSGLPEMARTLGLAGLAAGALIAVAEHVLPDSRRRLVPSASGLGIAMVMPGSASIAMFTGALLALVARTWAGREVDKTLVPIASGAIAGESLVGVALAITRAVR